jgi:hypothetical protein
MLVWLLLIPALTLVSQCAVTDVEQETVFDFTVDQRGIFAQEAPAVNENPPDYV